MVNDDVFIKYSRKRGHKTTWPDQVVYMKNRLTNMKLGFPGIGNNHLTLVEYKSLEVGDIFIYDPYVEICPEVYDEAPIMLSILSKDTCRIEGIGCGYDYNRDPDRIRFRWNDIITRPQFNPEFLVYKVDVRPDMNGGPGYYYFFKSYRDFRY